MNKTQQNTGGRVLRLPISSQLLYQIGRYSIVGTAASVTQFLVVIILVSQHMMEPLSANVIGYLCGFVVSFNGQRIWTFANGTRAMRAALPLFLIVTGINFSINQGMYSIFLKVFHLEYHVGLLCAMLVAAVVTFSLSKLVVFRD